MAALRGLSSSLLLSFALFFFVSFCAAQTPEEQPTTEALLTEALVKDESTEALVKDEEPEALVKDEEPLLGWVGEEEGLDVAEGNDRRLQADDEPLDLRNVWSYCDGFVPLGFTDVSVELSPNPPRSGRWLTVIVKGKNEKVVQKPTIHTLFVLNNAIPINEVRNYCDSHTCPVQPGDFEAKIRYYIPPFLAGSATGVATVLEEGSDKPLVCVNIGPLRISAFRWGG